MSAFARSFFVHTGSPRRLRSRALPEATSEYLLRSSTSHASSGRRSQVHPRRQSHAARDCAGSVAVETLQAKCEGDRHRRTQRAQPPPVPSTPRIKSSPPLAALPARHALVRPRRGCTFCPSTRSSARGVVLAERGNDLDRGQGGGFAPGWEGCERQFGCTRRISSE